MQAIVAGCRTPFCVKLQYAGISMVRKCDVSKCYYCAYLKPHHKQTKREIKMLQSFAGAAPPEPSVLQNSEIQ